MGILELKIQSQLMCEIIMNKNMPKIKLFLLFMYCLIYGKILKYMSFTIFIQSSLHNKPFRNKMIQGLLFRWAICGPWASCLLTYNTLPFKRYKLVNGRWNLAIFFISDSPDSIKIGNLWLQLKVSLSGLKV